MAFAVPLADEPLTSLRCRHRPIGCGQNAPKPADDGIAPLNGTSPLKFAYQDAPHDCLTELARQWSMQKLGPELCESLAVELLDVLKSHRLHREVAFRVGLVSIL